MSRRTIKSGSKLKQYGKTDAFGDMSPLFLSTYPPTACGLATFTQDLADAVDQSAGAPVSRVAAIEKDSGEEYDRRVVHVIDNNDESAYTNAARFCGGNHCDVVNIQHEYGLFSGEWGSSILDFAESCDKPIVTTLHTLSLKPEKEARRIINRLASLSSRVVVMAEMGAEILENNYGVNGDKVAVIPHGVHPMPDLDEDDARAGLGLKGRPMILTFGLINPGKGIEYTIRALPRIVSEYPDALYVIAGRTHPVVKAREGESYRESLAALAESLGVGQNVKFVNKYLSLDELQRYIAATDIYLTPYLGRDQIVSGTLAYAVSAGKVVISTPYLHATELARKGALLLVEFWDSEAIARDALCVLGNPFLAYGLKYRALAAGRDMQWRNVGRQYHELFASVCGKAVEPARRAAANELSSSYQRPVRLAYLSGKA